MSDYLKAILAAYEYKKAEGTLPLNLSHPTPGNLRNECIIVHRERYIDGDEQTLRSFFGAADRQNGFSRNIDNSRADEFRQLTKILRKEPDDPGLKNPGQKYIELLAWLIDFNPRPSTLYYQQKNNKKTANNPDILVPAEEEPSEKNSGEFQVTDHDVVETYEQINGKILAIDQGTDKIEGQTSAELEVIDHITDEPGKQKSDTGSLEKNRGDKGKEIKPTKPIRRIPIHTVAIACTILFLGAGTTFFFWKKKSDITINPILTSRCMYWTGDHYETIDCNEKISDAPVVSLDMQKLTNFKKISSPDTLTKDALGKVWYTKIAGEHQFFTDSGVHPLDTQKKLKPVTRYILSNHVSYYRYLLTLLIWSISVIIFIGLCSVFFIVFRKKRKKKTMFLGSPKILPDLLLSSFPPNQETSNG